MSDEAATAEVVHLPARHFVSTTDVFSDPASFEHAQRVAKVFASSNLVPPHLKGQVADCLIAYQIARRLNEEPLTVFQNIYVVSGRPGWKTEYVIARANKAGVFKNRISWKPSGEGDALAVTASAVLADSGETISVTCDMKMAKAENWTKNPKYTSMPEHMLRWRSAAMLIRLYAPEVMLGMPVIEELETLEPAPMRDISPAMRRSLDDFATGAAASQVDHDPETGEVTETDTDPAASAATGENSGDATEAGQAGPTGPDKASPASNSSSTPPKDASSSAASGQAAPEATFNPSRSDGVKGAATATNKTPANEAEYIAHARSWIDKLNDAAKADGLWKADKNLRNKANVSEEVREDLKKLLDNKVAEINDADRS